MVAELTHDYDDFLDLASLDLRTARLLVFSGVSGSGKSAAIRFLVQQHPNFRDRPYVNSLELDGGDLPLRGGHVVTVDEIWSVRQLPGIVGLLRRSNIVLVASHLKPLFFAPFQLFWPTRCFVMDRCRDKIARHLSRTGVVFSDDAVDRFCRVYGANYLDANHILERYPGIGFDRAFRMFQRHCRIDRVPDRAERGTS